MSPRAIATATPPASGGGTPAGVSGATPTSVASPPLANVKAEPRGPNASPNSTASTPAPLSHYAAKSETPPPTKRPKPGEDGGARRDVCVGTSVATITDPDCLGPCEPGTSVMLEGIVWHETEGGVLVVNVTWRGKTYVGTLLDCTRHDWAPPRFCDSPTSDIESRTPKGRGKRGRAATTTAGTPVNNDVTVTETRSGKLRNANVKGRRGNLTPTSNPPPSPVKSEPGGTKRKTREPETPDPKNWKRSRASSRGTPTNGASSPGPDHPSSPQLIECPEPNCNKKYKHINGLKYHQSHAHNNVANDDETTSTEGRAESEVEESRPPSPAPVAETPVDNTAQDVVKPSVLRYSGPPSTPSPGPSEEIAKGSTAQPPTCQPSVIQSRVPQVSQGGVYLYTGSGGVVSPQHPQVGSPVLGMSPIPGGLSQVRPGQIRPEVRPEVMMRIGTAVPRQVGPAPVGSPGAPSVPITPQGTPLSSLPGNSPGLIKVKQALIEPDKGKPKELVNGLVAKDTREEEQPSREDARSPAYSDISDANDTAPVLEGDSDNKDLQDDKKAELPLGPQPYPYGMYYPGPYGQPSPFLIPPIQPPPSTTPGKDGDNKDPKEKLCDKDKRDSLPPPGSSEYLNKIHPQYLYSPHYLYNPGYPDPYLRDPQIYKEAESKDLPPGIREGDKGPTDLSRSAPGIPGTVSLSPVIPKDKLSIVKDKQAENHAILKEAHELKGQLPGDKRPYEPSLAYRFPYDQRLPIQAQPQEKPGEKSTGLPKPSPPAPLSSPRVGSTPPSSSTLSKDDRGEKKPDSKSEGVKPTMETTGPPPPPTSSAYYPPFPYSALPYDPYRPPMVPPMSMPTSFSAHYLQPGMMPRFPLSSPANTPEDLSRGSSSGGMIHPSQLYSNHKIHELQERALKSPISSASMSMAAQGIMTTPQKIASPLANKDGALTPVTSSSSSSGSIPSSASSLVHGGGGPVGGGVEGRSPPTARPPTHHLHESFSTYSLISPQFHYTALGPGQTPTGATSGLAAAPTAK